MTAAAKDQSAKPEAPANGQPDPKAQAVAYEEAIREEALAIWSGDEGYADGEIDGPRLMGLRHLLRRPVPAGFIETVGNVPGKPYDSTGVKSVQVQMDRLDNVLGAHNWGYEATHSESGKLCHVKAWIGDPVAPLVVRDSWGGVQQGTGEGNIRKGAFTNAAKLALARLGPGWEVYVGAADFDPDTDPDAADAQSAPPEQPAAVKTIDAGRTAALMEAFLGIERADGDDDVRLKQELKTLLGSLGVSATGIGAAFAKLTPGQADLVDTWIAEQNGGES